MGLVEQDEDARNVTGRQAPAAEPSVARGIGALE